MAGHVYNIALDADGTSSGTLPLFQLIAPASRYLWVLQWSISGKSVNASDIPIRVEWVRQTSAGTSAGTITPAARGQYPAALMTVNKSFSAEPTDGGVIVDGPYYVSPVGGLFFLQSLKEREVEVANSGRLGLRIVCPQSTSVRANALVLE